MYVFWELESQYARIIKQREHFASITGSTSGFSGMVYVVIIAYLDAWNAIVIQYDHKVHLVIVCLHRLPQPVGATLYHGKERWRVC